MGFAWVMLGLSAVIVCRRILLLETIMSATRQQPIFERLSRLFDPLDPAELHGLLCGLLCAESALSHEQWLAYARAQLDQDIKLADSARDALLSFYEYGAAQLNDSAGSVTPLLPDDDTPLDQRTQALGAWCQGLLYGLGLGQADKNGALSSESQEFLRDATEIARVGFDTDQASEADEIAYAEVVEYLRVGLLLIQQDLQRPPTVPSNARLH